MEKYTAILVVGDCPSKYHLYRDKVLLAVKELIPEWECNTTGSGDVTEAVRTLTLFNTIDIVYFCNEFRVPHQKLVEDASSLAGAMAKNSNEPWISMPHEMIILSDLISAFEDRGVKVRQYPLVSLIHMRREQSASAAMEKVAQVINTTK